jgi:hypothetical protein
VLRWQVEGLELMIDDLVGSTGLELKVDPGIPYVYAGFGGKLHFPSQKAWAYMQCGSMVLCDALCEHS